MTSPSVHWTPSANVSSESARGGQNHPRILRTSGRIWIALDIASVVILAGVATMYRFHAGMSEALTGLINGTLIPGRSLGFLLTYLTGFAGALVLISRRLNLYQPRLFYGFLHEQRLSLEACLGSGLLLAGALYLVHADDVPRLIVVDTVLLVAASLGTRRLVYRIFLYRSLRRGAGVRNVLIVGTGPHAVALCQYLGRRSSLGYRFRGFIEVPGEVATPAAQADEIIGGIENIFDCARMCFADEIFLASPNAREGMTTELLEGARAHGVDLRVIPDPYDGWAWQNAVEYVGQVPTIPIHCEKIPEFWLLLKRTFDVAFSLSVLTLLSPLFAVLAFAVKLDSPGPVFYVSDRMGKRGRVFRCVKFRTMVQDADRRLTEVMHMNERDGVLFKVANDPRITPLGRLLRKYSLDELPQFWNVLRGEMSIVGPRPALAGEVSRYGVSHLRRLEVTPGITGLWQVQGRQDPSFASYISLDVTYIENWSLLLDIKIILRTIGVVLAGTGY